MSEPLLNKSQLQQLFSAPKIVRRWIVLWLCSVFLLIAIVAGIGFVANSEILPGLLLVGPPLLISICAAWMAWKPSAEQRRNGEVCSVLSKSQILELFSSPSIAARWFVLWLCSFMSLISIVLGLIVVANSNVLLGMIFSVPPLLVATCVAWMAWRPTARLRRFGEICSVLSVVPSLLLILAGFGSSAQMFNFMGGIFAIFGFAGLILGVTFLCLVEIACAGVPRRARGKVMQSTSNPDGRQRPKN